MRFLCLYKPKKSEGTPASRHDIAKLIDEMTNAGVLLATAGCQPSSKGARIQHSGGTCCVSEGPFPESEEMIGGFAIIQAQSKEEAIRLTKCFLRVAGEGESEIHLLQEAGLLASAA